MRNTKKQMGGFTLLECLVASALACVLTTMAIANTSGAMQNARVDSAVSTVSSQLRLARMVAISMRRNVLVTIDTDPSGPGNVQHINYQVVAANGEPEQPMQTAELPSGIQFIVETGVPDTPMQFGNSAAISFSSNSSTDNSQMQFTPLGAFTDGNGDVLNGTIFMGAPDIPNTARAVTVLGGVGSVQRYTWSGANWAR
jgi:prepilin-type N-terminal cleavage/methylation domain-containing protein